MNNPNKKRLRRTMMFLNAQKPGLIKDPYIYKPDSIMLDLEDAVAENQKDVARFSLYHALKTINYRGCERVVRINGLDTLYWREDIRASVAGGCDAIRIPKTESPKDVQIVEAASQRMRRPTAAPKAEVLDSSRLWSLPAASCAHWTSASLPSVCSASLCPAATTPRTCRPTSPAPAWS